MQSVAKRSYDLRFFAKAAKKRRSYELPLPLHYKNFELTTVIL